MNSCLRRLLGFLILIASLGVLVWGLLPAKFTKAVEAIAPNLMQLSQPNTDSEISSAQSIAPGVPETRRLNLQYPTSMRQGDSDVIQLTLEVDDQGNITPTAQFQGQTVTGDTVQIPDVYATHNVFFEARLDLPGMNATPAELVSLPVQPGRKVNIAWTVKPSDAGNFRGAVWSFLRFVPIEGGEGTQQAISSQAIEVKVVNLLGIGGQPARIMGLIGSLLGSSMSIQDIVWKILFPGRKRKDDRKRR